MRFILSLQFILMLTLSTSAQTFFPFSTAPSKSSGEANTAPANPTPPKVPAPLPGNLPKIDVPRQLTLDKALEILSQNNQAIIAARYGIDITRAQRMFAAYKPNPTISYGFEGWDIQMPGKYLLHTNGNSAANRTYTFRYDQLIERGDKRRLRTEVAEFQTQAAEAQALDAVRQQTFQLKQAFYAAVLARENLRVADENLYLINNTQQLIALHVKTGDTAEGDLIKFQSNMVQYQRDIVTSQLTFQQSARDILNLLGSTPSNVSGTVIKVGLNKEPDSLTDAPLDPVGNLMVAPMKLELDELRQAALASRPDVIAAQRNVDAAQKALELANALRRRDVDVALEYQRQGGENTVGVVVSVPFFLHNNHQAEIDQAAAQLKQAETQFNQVKLQVLTDIDKAYRAYEISQRLLQIYTAETLDKAEESFRIAGVAYKQGATSLLELLDAQRTLNQIRVATNQARYDYRMSIYQLELSTGKLLLK